MITHKRLDLETTVICDYCTKEEEYSFDDELEYIILDLQKKHWTVWNAGIKQIIACPACAYTLANMP